MERKIVIGEKCVRLEDIIKIMEGFEVILSPRVLEKLSSSREKYLKEVRKRKIYGYCTGLGELFTKSSEKCDREIERHILREHAMGIGSSAPEKLVKLFLITRLIQLSRGRAPIRPIVAQRLLDAINRNIIPIIPIHGSVGASGDLVPSAHAFLCLYYGEGEAYHKGTRRTCSEALSREGLKPLELEPGEALALINNTAWTTSLGIASWLIMDKLINKSIEISKKTLKASNCVREHYSPELSKASQYEEFSLILNRLAIDCTGNERLQDPYSFRCSPQYYTAVLRVHRFLGETIARETCSSTENPIVVDDKVYHWCGFNSINISIAIDFARIAVSILSNLIERRIAQLLRKEINGITNFLAGEEDTVGAMITQYTAAALTSQNRTIASPVTVNSIPTSGLQEDVVPMGPESGLLLLKALYNLAGLIAIEEAVADYAITKMTGGISALRDRISKGFQAILKESGLEFLLPTN